MANKIVENLHNTIGTLQDALNEEIDKMVLEGKVVTAEDESGLGADLSARYWLMQFLEPLSRKELKSVVDGFLVQLLNDDQAKKLVRFLLVRFPHYYKEEKGEGTCPNAEEEGQEKSITFKSRSS